MVAAMPHAALEVDGRAGARSRRCARYGRTVFGLPIRSDLVGAASATRWTRSVAATFIGFAVLVSVAACSAPGGLPGIGDGNDDVAFCRIAAQLPTAADLVPLESLDDPASFDATLRAAVDTYLENLDAMSARSPRRTEQQIKLLMSAVDQYRFADAIDARVAVDESIAATCAGTATTSTTAA